MTDSQYSGQGQHSDIHRMWDPLSPSSNVIADREGYSWFTENFEQGHYEDENFYLDQLVASLVDYNCEDIADSMRFDSEADASQTSAPANQPTINCLTVQSTLGSPAEVEETAVKSSTSGARECIRSERLKRFRDRGLEVDSVTSSLAPPPAKQVYLVYYFRP